MPESKLQFGQRIGNYVLQSKIGEGAYGQVWKATHHERPDRVVALKVATDVTLCRQLSREGGLPDLHHPNVVPVLDADTRFAEQPYVVMPFYNKGTLEDMIAQSPKGLVGNHIIDLLRDILAGLSAAHEKGIVHRDVKPSNILIGDDNRPLISDFGLSLDMSEPNARHSMLQSTSVQRHAEGGIAGTLAYLAPEIMNGQNPSPASDIFSLGVIVFELLIGRRPCGPEKPSDARSGINDAFDWDWLYGAACGHIEKRPPNAASLVSLIDRIAEFSRKKRKADAGESWRMAIAFVTTVVALGTTIGAGFLGSYVALVVSWFCTSCAWVYVAEERLPLLRLRGIFSFLIICGIVLGIPLVGVFFIARLVWNLIK